MNKYHLHNYRETWIDVTGIHKRWTEIDDSYLYNIHRKIERSGNRFPAQALYYCQQEVTRRKGIKMNHYQQPQMPAMPAQHYGDSMNMTERPVQIVTRIKDEQLPEYFLKKVRWFENGEDFKVIGIKTYGIGSGKQLTLMPIKGGQKIELDAHDVDIVKQIAVYAYQHKNGDINYSSKVIAPSVMKKQGIKKIESATKYFDA